MIADFEYFAPVTVKEALTLISKYKGEAKIIAGGQSILVIMKQRMLTPEYVVDIKGLSDLDYIDYNAGDGLRIGALTTHRTVERSPLIKEKFSLLSEMEGNLATIQTRNWGTIGGNICHGDPAGDPAPVLIALNAKLKLQSLAGDRMVDMEDFSKDYLEVDLKPGEMLTEIKVPDIAPNTGMAYEKLMVMKGDMGVVGAAVSISLGSNDGVCRDCRIVLCNAASIPLRVKEAEKVLAGNKISESLLARASEVASEEAAPPADVHGSAEYRRELVKVFVKRVGLKALERARAA